jgi:hypothetical protein
MYRLAFGICAVATVLALPVSAQQPRGPVVSATPRVESTVVRATPSADRTTQTVLPGTPARAFTTVHGNALDSGGRMLPHAPLRLRDARVGRIVASQFSDNAGIFAFAAVDPGSYVIELLAAERNVVLAASEVVNVNAGETVSVIVRLPRRRTPLGAILNNPAQAGAIAAVAAATGVLTRSATVDVSCEQLPCNQ